MILHLQETHDDGHGSIIVTLAGGRGRLWGVSLGIGRPLHDLLGEGERGGLGGFPSPGGRGSCGGGAAAVLTVIRNNNNNNNNIVNNDCLLTC